MAPPVRHSQSCAGRTGGGAGDEQARRVAPRRRRWRPRAAAHRAPGATDSDVRAPVGSSGRARRGDGDVGGRTERVGERPRAARPDRRRRGRARAPSQPSGTRSLTPCRGRRRTTRAPRCRPRRGARPVELHLRRTRPGRPGGRPAAGRRRAPGGRGTSRPGAGRRCGGDAGRRRRGRPRAWRRPPMKQRGRLVAGAPRRGGDVGASTGVAAAARRDRRDGAVAPRASTRRPGRISVATCAGRADGDGHRVGGVGGHLVGRRSSVRTQPEHVARPRSSMSDSSGASYCLWYVAWSPTMLTTGVWPGGRCAGWRGRCRGPGPRCSSVAAGLSAMRA